MMMSEATNTKRPLKIVCWRNVRGSGQLRVAMPLGALAGATLRRMAESSWFNHTAGVSNPVVLTNSAAEAPAEVGGRVAASSEALKLELAWPQTNAPYVEPARAVRCARR